MQAAVVLLAAFASARPVILLLGAQHFASDALRPLALLLFAPIFFLVARRIRAEPRPAWQLFDAAMLVWLGAVALSTALHDDDDGFAWSALVPYALVTVGWLVARARASTTDTLAGSVALAAFVLAVSVILDGERLWPASGLQRPGGLLGNRNHAAEWLALALPLLLHRASERRRAWLAFVVVGAALAWTRCRTGWLAAGLAVALTVAMAPPSLRRALGRATLALALGAVVAMLLPNRLSWREPHPTLSTLARLVDLEGGSGRMRVRQHVRTGQLVAPSPLLGLGPGAWQPAMRRLESSLALNNRPHSEYLRALADGGVVALAALVTMLAAAALAAWQARRTQPAALATVLALALVAAADTPLYRPEVLAWWWMWMAQLRSERAAQFSAHSMPGVIGSPRRLQSQGSV